MTAFLWEAMLHPERGGMDRKREQVYADWLSAQLDRIGGARLDVQRTKLVSFQRTRAIRKLHAPVQRGAGRSDAGASSPSPTPRHSSICWLVAWVAIAPSATGCCSFAPPVPRHCLQHLNS